MEKMYCLFPHVWHRILDNVLNILADIRTPFLTEINILSRLYYTTDWRKSRYRLKKNMEKSERRKRKQTRKTACLTVIVPITSDSESLSCPVKREKANQYCHSQLQIKLFLLLLPPCSFLGHSICRNGDKRISIDCWWDQRINKWNVFFSSPFVFSSKMGREWSNGAKHIKRRQSSTNTIKPWSRNYFPRRGSIAVQMFLQFRVSCHKPLNALK